MTKRSSDIIYSELRKRILDGEYGRGKFIGERDLAEEFQVSRAPIRDALQRLSQEGYLISEPRKGHSVNRISAEHLLQIQQLRFQLESLTLSLLIKNASDESLDTLALKKNDSNNTNPYRTDNTFFHHELAKLTGNESLANIVYRYLGDCSLAVFQNPEIVKQETNYHVKILDAIKERNFKQAQFYLAKDLQIEQISEMDGYLPL